MLTVRGIFKDGQITLLEQVSLTSECQVLVTFLDYEGEVAVISKERRDQLVEKIRESGLGLSPRELEVLKMAQKGLRTQEIADELGITDGVVRNYLSSIYEELKVHTRIEAIKKAVELGILEPFSGL